MGGVGMKGVEMRGVEEHLAHCLASVRPLTPLDLPLEQALDCVLAEDVESPGDLPPFDNSAMDGYAVQLPDVATAAPDRPARLPVVADLPAGTGDQPRLAPGVVARIMTGAPLPLGTDAVVPVEWTDGGLATVSIVQAPEGGQYLRRAGEDVRAGEVVLRAGVRLSPRHIGLLAAVGRERVRVRPRPRVVVVATGNELVEPGRPLRFGQIHDSNGFALAAAAAELGCAVHRVPALRDDPRVLLSALLDQALRADVVITSGGVSAGAYDTVKEVLSRLGTVAFDKVAMQPGMPQGFGTLGADATTIFTLPGNPVSSMVSFEVFVRPVLRKLAGEASLHRHSVTAVAAHGWASPHGKRQYVRAVLDRRPQGEDSTVTPVGGQGSHLVADLAEASCLAVVPEEVTQVRAGDRLTCMLLDRVHR